MTRPLVVALPGNEPMAEKLAAALGADLGRLETRGFPDGETYLRFVTDPAGRTLVLVCTLDRPDPKFLRLVFAASAARDLGARRVGVVAPYLAYLRQDKSFNPGEAITSVAFARLLSHLRHPVCIAVHGLFSDESYGKLKEVASTVVTTDSVTHPSNAIDLAPIIAQSMAGLV